MKRMTLLAVAVLACATGCAPLQMIGGFSHQEDFRTHDTLALPDARPDLVTIIEETGKSLGFRVSAIDRGSGAITLTTESSVIGEVLIRKVNRADYHFQVLEGGRKLDITVIAVGNLGSGGQEAADKMLADMKAAIAKRLEAGIGSK